MKWEIVDTGLASAEKNMATDIKLLETLKPHDKPILHFYDWEADSATYGYFLDPLKFLHLEAIQNFKIQIAKRPTGGGIVFHLCDLAFSALIPSSHPSFSINTMENYAYINSIVLDAVQNFIGSKQTPSLLPKEIFPLDETCKNFCMAKPTKYDVMLNQKKVGGGAQRRSKNGYLHQGTISLAMPPESFLEKIFIKGNRVHEAMRQHSYLLLEGLYTSQQLSSARYELKNFLKITIESL
jgi:lipoate---protein ligase